MMAAVFTTVVTLLLAAPAVFAHAILLDAAPAPKTAVAGPDVAIRLRFNSRVDGARSHVTLVSPDAKERTLPLDAQGKPDTLTSTAAGLKPGSYKLRWQVLAADGHITRGEIPFQVK